MIFRRVRTERPDRPLATAVVGLVLLASAAPRVAAGADHGALWRLVHDLCVPDMKLRGRPAPCSKVDPRAGYALLKDRERRTQFLLVPTARVTGIEDVKLLSPLTPNYWQLSWENRDVLEARVHRTLPRDEVGMAVNSIYGRSQNQLHIHIDCVRADVARELAAHRDEITPHWRPLDVALVGRRYVARWIPDADLATTEPFKLLAELPEARVDMGRQTLVLVGATSARNEPGFVLLADQADPDSGNRGHGEDLLDHACHASEASP